MEVIRVEEYGVHPLPTSNCDYSHARMSTKKDYFRQDIKPLIITQPEGPSYILNGLFVFKSNMIKTFSLILNNIIGNHIQWQKYEMVIGFTGNSI